VATFLSYIFTGAWICLAISTYANPVEFQWPATTNGLTGYLLIEGYTSNSMASLFVAKTNCATLPECDFPIGVTYWAVAQNGDAGKNGERIAISGVVAIQCAAHVVVNGETNAIIWTATSLNGPWTLLGAGPIVFPVATNPQRFWMGNGISITRSNSVQSVSNSTN
jgi:hypothetical protein